jgi:GTPase SAR1 family protein
MYCLGSSSRRYQKTAQRIRAPLFRKIENAASRNIVIFGETGTGKSSLINMLSDNEVATVSNLAVGGTFESTPYPITIDGEHYTLWDTAGLNEGDAGSVPADAALDHLRDLVEKLHDGLSLLVYCIRGSRYRDIIKVNYDLFTKIICQGEVPVVIVVTGLENEDRMDDWWIENEKEFTSRKMRFDGHACVTTTKGKKNMFEEEYEESRVALRALMKVQCPSDAWLVDSDAWFQRITTRIQEYYDDYNGYSAGALMDIDVKENSPSGSLSALGAFFSLLLALIRR